MFGTNKTLRNCPTSIKEEEIHLKTRERRRNPSEKPTSPPSPPFLASRMLFDTFFGGEGVNKDPFIVHYSKLVPSSEQCSKIRKSENLGEIWTQGWRFWSANATSVLQPLPTHQELVWNSVLGSFGLTKDFFQSYFAKLFSLLLFCKSPWHWEQNWSDVVSGLKVGHGNTSP